MTRFIAAVMAAFLCIPAQASECRPLESMISEMQIYNSAPGIFGGHWRSERYKALYKRATGRGVAVDGSGYIVWIMPSGAAQTALMVGTDACYLLTVTAPLIPTVRAFLTEPGA